LLTPPGHCFYVRLIFCLSAFTGLFDIAPENGCVVLKFIQSLFSNYVMKFHFVHLFAFKDLRDVLKRVPLKA